MLRRLPADDLTLGALKLERLPVPNPELPLPERPCDPKLGRLPAPLRTDDDRLLPVDFGVALAPDDQLREEPDD